MTAVSFVVSRSDSGRHAASALVCVGAGYFSVMLPGVDTLARRVVNRAQWEEIAREISEGFAPAGLSASSTIARLICDGDASMYRVQYVSRPTITSGPETIASALDRTLREVTS